ncbi:hypothetical protein LR48_Vigan01g199200 [Vigna angularis]|uniref:Uncharacterized protein n=1 Tax=Phaseolus angularis TaxID=3914 RepID=A0A0L9TPN5_PHAAN|nr:hypothetical protein LR48_Vigan01g199200 [Vigna angularis]
MTGGDDGRRRTTVAGGGRWLTAGSDGRWRATKNCGVGQIYIYYETETRAGSTRSDTNLRLKVRTVKRRRRDDDQTTGAKAASQPTASQESISNGPAKRTRGKKKNDVCCFDAP